MNPQISVGQFFFPFIHVSGQKYVSAVAFFRSPPFLWIVPLLPWPFFPPPLQAGSPLPCLQGADPPFPFPPCFFFFFLGHSSVPRFFEAVRDLFFFSPLSGSEKFPFSPKNPWRRFLTFVECIRVHPLQNLFTRLARRIPPFSPTTLPPL